MLLYIHIPFCDSKCSYCSFNSYVDKFHLRQNYMQALLAQLRFELERFRAAAQSIETVFIGGGTPSTVAPELYAPLFDTLAPYLAEGAEITSEANPNSATKAWLEGMHALGVNRISFGVQSFDAQKLKLLARAHTATQAVQAVENAALSGFKHLSLDLIYATALDTQKLLENDLERAFSLPIDHLSAYALTLEEGTPLAKRPQSAVEKIEQTRRLFRMIEAHGFTQYEISNFGTCRSRHNMGYWEYRNYIGLGSGAVGFLNDRRLYPATHVEHYIAHPNESAEESLSPEDISLEKIFLGLRSCTGVSNETLNPRQRERAALLCNEKKLDYAKGRYYNPDFLLSDELALFIDV